MDEGWHPLIPRNNPQNVRLYSHIYIALAGANIIFWVLFFYLAHMPGGF